MAGDRNKVYTLLTQLGVNDPTLLSCVTTTSLTNSYCGSNSTMFNNNKLVKIDTSQLTYTRSGVNLSELSVISCVGATGFPDNIEL